MDNQVTRTSARKATLGWLLAAALFAAVLVGLSVIGTRQRISRNEAKEVSRMLSHLLPTVSYDNLPGEDEITLVDPELLGSPSPMPVYRVRRGTKLVAAVMTVIARQGYIGPIDLLVAINADGTVIAVRAISHHETPGLGDRIDRWRSSWIDIFAGRSLGDPPTADWAVSRDGGAFDQLTGATITSRAVVNAVRDAALCFEKHRAEISSPPANQERHHE